MRFFIDSQDVETTEVLAGVIARVMSARGAAAERADSPEAFGAGDIILSADAARRDEGFDIAERPTGVIEISGHGRLGLLFGLGKFLRTSTFLRQQWIPSPWRGTSFPQKDFRIIYFASHFNNYYQEAPLDDVRKYIEDLALWGYNSLSFWFDMHPFASIRDQRVHPFLERLKSFARFGKRLGMRIVLCGQANEGYNSTPERLRATPTGRSHYGVEICPSSREGLTLMLSHKRELFEAFAGIEVDGLILWPYDQGGCSCDACRPWGSNGMLRAGNELADLFHQFYPKGQIVFSTWLFDYKTDQKEWEGLGKAFKDRPDWVDFIMADSHETFPEYPLIKGVPGGLPLLNFPEISMWGMWPWGGFGANPLPRRFSGLWNQTARVMSGGSPYSEGIHEDVNKALYAQFYWNGNGDYEDSLREYAGFEFGCQEGAAFIDAVLRLEQAHAPRWRPEINPDHFSVPPIPPKANPIKTFEIMCGLDANLPEWGRRAWRWRILYLRSLLDAELFKSVGEPTVHCEEAFLELTAIYHATHGNPRVKPPSTRVRANAAKDIDAWRRSFNEVDLTRKISNNE